MPPSTQPCKMACLVTLLLSMSRLAAVLCAPCSKMESVEPLVASLAADDACSGGGSECALSVLQYAGGSSERAGATVLGRAREQRMTHHPGVALSSSFFSGSGPSRASCTSEALDDLSGNSALTHSFGASGAGAIWQYSCLVISDGPKPSAVDLGQPVYVELTASASNNTWVQPTLVNVGGMSEGVPASVKFEAVGTEECPPTYCLLPKPMGPNLEGEPSAPRCGWAPPVNSTSVAGPLAGNTATLRLDITELVAAKYTIFKVWVSPAELSRSMWQTSDLTVTSWGFTWAPRGSTL